MLPERAGPPAQTAGLCIGVRRTPGRTDSGGAALSPAGPAPARTLLTAPIRGRESSRALEHVARDVGAIPTAANTNKYRGKFNLDKVNLLKWPLNRD